MTNITRYIRCLAFILLSPVAAIGIDHSNIDEDRPLDLEDAYSIDFKEWAIEGGLGYLDRGAVDHGFFPVQLLYGALLNTHVSLGSTFVTRPRAFDEETRSGDMQIGILHNFNQATLSGPAFGLKFTANLPTGEGSNGTDYEIKGIITHQLESGVALHLNAIANLLDGVPAGDRDDTYKLIGGASWAPGSPMDTRTVLLANVFTEEASLPGDENTVGAGFGARYQLNQQVVLDAGLTSEFEGAVDRERLQATIGASYGF